MSQIKKVVFPVAGLGTRFLPATKASPKEMLPVVDKPLIQYAVEEAVEAGADTMIFVNGRHKRAIEDHFDMAEELERDLEAKNKTALLEILRDVCPPSVNFVHIRQPKALGLGHAVLCARPVVGDEPFGVILADDLIMSEGPGCLAQMSETFNYRGGSILGVQEVPREDTGRYGVVDAEVVAENLMQLRGIVEKPNPADAPSTSAVVGRYILTPAIFDLLANLGAGAGGEIQLTDGIAKLLQTEAVYGYGFAGKRFDCGSKLGYLMANVEYGLAHEELGDGFGDYLKAFAAKL